MEKTLNKKVLTELGELSKSINARSKGVRFLLESYGIEIPKTKQVKLYHIYLAAKKNPAFLEELGPLLNFTAYATGSWTDWAAGIANGLGTLFTSIGSSDAEKGTDEQALQMAAMQVQAEKEKSNMLKWITIGSVVLVVIVLIIVIIKYRKK